MTDTLSRQQRHRKLRRERGLCVVEGCAEASGELSRCPVHAKAHAERERRRYREAAEPKRTA